MEPSKSHHRLQKDIAVALLGGLVASFSAMSFSTLSGRLGGLSGQLLAGDVAVNRTMPTTLNAMKDGIDGMQALSVSLSSPVWWSAVMLGGLAAAFLLFKWMRHYI
jgi:hypothetical protein